MSDIYSYEPKAGHGLPHDPFNAIVAPRPIGWISTLSADGVANLAPYSFFNAFCYRPPIIGFASNGHKHTLANARTQGEFVWSLVTRPLAAAMNQTSGDYPEGVDEFAEAGLTTAAGRIVAPPRVAESPVALECRVSDIHRLRSAAGEEADSWLVLGEVVCVHIDRALLEDGIYQTAKAEPVTRGGGPSRYFGLGMPFDLFRPKV